jgi:hypothetical protein
MVKDFQDANPQEEIGNYIGRDILEKILNQPDCMGIRFYNAINEKGKKTLVYVGVNSNDKLISEYVVVNKAGELIRQKGIVADRAGVPTKGWDWDFDWPWWD